MNYLCREQSGFLEAETKDFFALKARLYWATLFFAEEQIQRRQQHCTSQKDTLLPPVCPGVRMKNVSAIKKGKEETDKVTLRL